MDIDKFYKWEDMAVSSILHLMIKWFNFERVEMTIHQRHNVETGMWYDIKIEKDGKSWGVSSQRLELLRERLIKFLDGENVREDYLKREGEKIKVSSHESIQQGANSGQLQQHVVMESLRPTDDEIGAKVEEYGFRVPYDGSNNFYDDEAIKHFRAGAEWALRFGRNAP